MNRPVYITGAGQFLPGEPIGNDEIEKRLGAVRGKPSRAKARVLRQNGIKTRHFALDDAQRSVLSNTEMAALAVEDALARAGLGMNEIDMLAAASTQGDLLLPGFASTIHHRLGGRPCEIASLHGVCASGMQAMQSAAGRIRAGDARAAVACASEYPSRLFKASHFEDVTKQGESLPFEMEFLRWMLSDGAGAVVLEDRPSRTGISLRLEFIELNSHAHSHDVAMTAGLDPAPGRSAPGPASWLDLPTFSAAADLGLFNIRQDVRRLDALVALGVADFFNLLERRQITPESLDWVLCHYSSDVFLEKIHSMIAAGGVVIPAERWFNNMAVRGNTGSASMYLMIEELLNTGRILEGQRMLCFVPESGGFITSFALLTAVTAGSSLSPSAASRPAPLRRAAGIPPARPPESGPLSEPAEAPGPELDPESRIYRQLAGVWAGFESRLAAVPLLRRLDTGRFTREDYAALLLNLRQQVVEGSRWIARAASSVSAEHGELRSLFIHHARDEHRDYEMLERHYVSLGGTLEEIRGAPKNIGSEALSAWMFHRAGRENPFDLLGAMFIIEGLGQRKARGWGERIRDQLGLMDDDVKFFLYHGENDDNHLERMRTAIRSVLTPGLAAEIVQTARVTARLYALQLEEIAVP